MLREGDEGDDLVLAFNKVVIFITWGFLPLLGYLIGLENYEPSVILC